MKRKNCQQSVIIPLFLMSIFFLFQGCTVRYKTQGYAAKIDEQINQIKNFSGQVKTIHAEARHTYKKTNGHKDQAMIKNEMGTLDRYYLKIKEYEKNIMTKGKALKAAIKGKATIDSKDPAYKMMKDFNKYLKEVQSDLVSKKKDMEHVKQKFQEFIKKVGIYEVKTKDMKQKLTSALKDMDQKIKTARNMLGEADKLVPRFQKQYQDMKKKNLSSMKKILRKIEDQKKSMKSIANDFYQEVKGKGEKIKIYPKMKSHGILQKIHDQVKKINQLSNQFNNEANQFKQVPQK